MLCSLPAARGGIGRGMELHLPEVMLAAPVETLPAAGWAFEAKWDGSPDT